MASGFPERDLRGAFGIGTGSVIQIPFQQRSDGGSTAAGGLLKRSLTELEYQQQIQHALFLRSVKQRTHLASPVDLSYFVSPASSVTSVTTSGSSSFAVSPRIQNARVADLSFLTTPPPLAAPVPERKSTAMRNQLEELERQLLDDDEEEAEPSASESAVTASEWGETMQQLISPPPAAIHNPLSSPSPTPSSSSSSSSASCSPGSSAPSRQRLIDTAAAIAEGNMEAAAGNLAVLKRASNPRGDPEQRLTAMMTTALLSRVIPPPPTGGGVHHQIAELCNAEHQAATQMLYDLSPCFKLALVACNLAILDATVDSPKIHILDFDVGQGAQYAALLHALVDRHRRGGGRPPSVKITAVFDPTYPLNCFGEDRIGNIRAVGDRIARLAERAGVGLRFSVVSRRAAELEAAELGCEPGEALAVNFAFHLSRVADESVSPANPRDELLRLARRLSPRVVVVAEQEMSGNTAPFAARFGEACGYYGAVLESLGATAGREMERERAEGCLARRAANSVAREGAERVERCEVFGKWRARMGMAGLRPAQLGPAVTEPVKSRINSLRPNPGFTVKEEAGGLCLGWLGRVLTVASAWR